ncbi:EAL domain-containing protein [Aurantiacibacter odishensis]|uniref:EAL domain-containing protein n=1 Tax=Aurantiacibacter odishensis TaxID=1155476 RepID=UPI001F0C6E15|nr:EAL domain-containing protein [Aurantiacibacter odishensis]
MERTAGRAVDRIKRAAAVEMQSAAGASVQTSDHTRNSEDDSSDSAPEANPAASAASPKRSGAKADRRSEERRKRARGQNNLPPEHVLAARQLFPRTWPFLPLTVFLAVLGCANVASGPPGLASSISFASAIVLLILSRYVYDLVITRAYPVQVFGLVVAVVLPLSLVGYGLTTWGSEGTLSPVYLGAAASATFAIAAIYLRRHALGIVAAQIGLYAPMFFNNNVAGGLLGFLMALTLAMILSRREMEEQARLEETRAAQERINTRAQDILWDYEQTGQGWFWETDRRSLLTYVSPPVAEALRLKPHKLVGQPLTRLFDLADTGEESERTLMFHLSARSAFSELSVRAAIVDEERWWSVSGRPLYDHFDNFIGFRGSGTDLTERKRSQEHATRLARYDSLTGLANRFTMSQSLEKILSAPQITNRSCTVFLLDLDRFKQVNDTMGHPAGDALLKQVATRLQRAVGKMGQVGRLGGDEFKVIIPGRVERDTLGDLAREIINSLSQPYTIEGQRVVIGASVGIAIAPDDGATSDEIIRNADLALYAAKDGGRGRSHFYSQELHADAEARSQMEEDLRDALAKGQLQMFYQPVVSTTTETITGFEALMRWQHPVKGWISPQRFIESAEDTGMIQQLGDWALRQACEQLASWPEEIRVAVNVSPLQFANPQLPGIVANAIAATGIHPSQLELEITESVFLQDSADTDAMFRALKNIGVRLALDDFGTGYSSLGYLKKAPFDKIKIDKSFVRGITEEDSRNAAIISSITSLAHSLGMETTAEGVETMDELDLVRMHGCSHVQGFIYERPLDAERASQRLASGLEAIAHGPRCSRAPRQKMLRKVVLDHSGHLYNGTIRNISTTGALIEGLWHVPVGTLFKLQLSQTYTVLCTTRWSEDDRMGVEFANALARDASGRIAAIEAAAPAPIRTGEMHKAG